MLPGNFPRHMVRPFEIVEFSFLSFGEKYFFLKIIVLNISFVPQFCFSYSGPPIICILDFSAYLHVHHFLSDSLFPPFQLHTVGYLSAHSL